MFARRGSTPLPSPCTLLSSRSCPYRPATILHASNPGKQIQARASASKESPPAADAGGLGAAILATFRHGEDNRCERHTVIKDWIPDMRKGPSLLDSSLRVGPRSRWRALSLPRRPSARRFPTGGLRR